MNDKRVEIIRLVQILAKERGIDVITIQDICIEAKITKEEFYTIFKDDDDLVETILLFAREKFLSVIDKDYSSYNAVEILLVVSKKINTLYNEVNPFMTVHLKKNFQHTYQKHFDIIIDYIYEKISINLSKGIEENLYRKDLSVELVARLYISRLIDIHNPDLFPPSKVSFKQLFEVMFENFVRGIATTEGLVLFEKNRPQNIK